MPLIEIQGMERHYEMASEVVKALDGVSINIEKGERIVLLGPSGSGKTTLLNCVAALDSPTKGTYDFDGKTVLILTIVCYGLFRKTLFSHLHGKT